MSTGFSIAGEGDIEDLYVSPAEMLALNQSNRLTLNLIGPLGVALYAWGTNLYGSLGTGNVINKGVPTLVNVSDWLYLSNNGDNGASALAIKQDGTLWAWGHGGYSQLGLGDLAHRSSPTQVGSLTNWKSVSCGGNGNTFAVKKDGTLWAWGLNGSGCLGTGDTTGRSSPVQIGSLTDWKTVCSSGNASGAATTCAIKQDGTLWAWGDNTFGQLGLNDIVGRSSPVQVGSLTNWATIYVGDRGAIFGIKTDGTLWSWGNNTYGNLGINSVVHKSSPVQVGALTDWLNVVASKSSAYMSALALKKDGTLWSWGDNISGNLGIGNVLSKSSPVQIGSLTDWKSIGSCGGTNAVGCFAIKKDGTLWAWGDNMNSQLGTNDSTNRSSPVQIGSATTWLYVAGFDGNFAIGLRSVEN